MDGHYRTTASSTASSAPSTSGGPPSTSESASATSGPTTTSSTVIIPSDTAFVLQGLNTSIYANMFIQFDDTNGKVVLGSEGTARFVSFRLGSNGVLVNADDASEFAFIRYNNSIRTEYPQEDSAVLSTVRSVLHGNQEILDATDFTTVWSFDPTTGQLGLDHDGRQYILYLTPATANLRRARSGTRNRGLYEQSISYNVYMIPVDVPVPSDSTFQKVSLQVDNAATFPSSDFASTLTMTSELTGSASESPLISTSSSATRTGTRTSSRPISTSRNSSSSSSTRTQPDAYDIITIYHLQEFCTSLLSYYTPEIVVATTSTRMNTVYQPLFTDIQTDWSSILTVPRSTLTTGSPIPNTAGSTHRLLERDTPGDASDWRLDLLALDDTDRFTLYFQLDTTTFIATPDDSQNPITGTFCLEIDVFHQGKKGTLKFTDDIKYWEKNSFEYEFQNSSSLMQINGKNVNIFGGGTIDGNSQKWIDEHAVNNMV
ncbi:hypothetical protein Dda_6765 [Drechslerella dactyloides]|uniref:Uncharacterized protein n=1 Tax=Drechslerella dactyloides TaxID=74499 RepID=A0AAD6NHQ0_DREDA|nr:hypothetical protein Dda_6765 [Drechslerella dactyloides]